MAFYIVLEVDGVSRVELEADTSDLLLENQGGVDELGALYQLVGLCGIQSYSAGSVRIT